MNNRNREANKSLFSSSLNNSQVIKDPYDHGGKNSLFNTSKNVYSSPQNNDSLDKSTTINSRKPEREKDTSKTKL
jgi:hypothetical protein